MRRLLALALLPRGAAGQGLTNLGMAQPTSDGDMAGFAAISRAFTARLDDRFPPATPVADLKAALLAEGFAMEGAAAARRSERGFLRDLVWLARWTEAEGAVVAVEGEHAGICI